MYVYVADGWAERERGVARPDLQRRGDRPCRQRPPDRPAVGGRGEQPAGGGGAVRGGGVAEGRHVERRGVDEVDRRDGRAAVRRLEPARDVNARDAVEALVGAVDDDGLLGGRLGMDLRERRRLQRGGRAALVGRLVLPLRSEQVMGTGQRQRQILRDTEAERQRDRQTEG